MQGPQNKIGSIIVSLFIAFFEQQLVWCQLSTHSCNIFFCLEPKVKKLEVLNRMFAVDLE